MHSKHCHDVFSYIYTCVQLSFIVVVRFLRNESIAAESDGVMEFTIITPEPSDRPFSVLVCTRETVPQSAEGLLEELHISVTD